MSSRVPVYQALDATTKTCSVEYLHAVQGFPVDANRDYVDSHGQTTTIRRYNKGIVRWPEPWSSKQISFNAVVTPITNTDGAFAVVVDGVLVQTIQPAGAILPNAGALYPVRCYANNLPIAPGGSVVEVWEPDAGRDTPFLDTGTDGPVHGGYVTGAWLPPGQRITRAQADTVIVLLGDSIPSSTNLAPARFYGMAGQAQLLAQAKGWLFIDLSGGSYTQFGDGFTAAQQAALIQQAVAATGATTVYVLYEIGRNDYKYRVFGGPIQQTPTDVQTSIQTSINALPAGWHKVVCTTMTQGAAQEGAINGFTLQQFRNAEALITGATILDGTAAGIIPAIDLYDDVHELPGVGKGVAKNLAFVQASVGL